MSFFFFNLLTGQDFKYKMLKVLKTFFFFTLTIIFSFAVDFETNITNRTLG